MAIVVSVLALLLFPILIVAEKRGNPLLTRRNPEDVPDRVYALWVSFGFFAVCLFNAILFLFFGTRRQSEFRRRQADRNYAEWNENHEL